MDWNNHKHDTTLVELSVLSLLYKATDVMFANDSYFQKQGNSHSVIF